MGGLQGDCLCTNTRAGSFPEEPAREGYCKMLSVGPLVFSLLSTPWFLADAVPLYPITANVSPSETLKGSIESQGTTCRAKCCGQPMPVNGASSCMAAPKAPLAFPETVLQHVGHGKCWQGVPRSIQLWRRWKLQESIPRFRQRGRKGEQWL